MTASLGSLSSFHPPCFCRTGTGEILIANGLDKIKRWDGRTASFENAGIPAGGAALTIGSSGVGTITGDYKAYYRFIDDEGQPGVFSTVSSEISPSLDAQIDYSAIPATAGDSRVTQVQIFRNTDGQYDVFYLDATVNIGTTTATSTKTDTQLIASTAQPILTDELDGERLSAMRYGVPPDSKSVITNLHERTFYLADVPYNDGHISLTNGSATVTGIGTAFTDPMDGRYLQVLGDTAQYLIDAVNTSAQTLTLSVVYAGSTNLFAGYAIYADPDTTDIVYFSERNEPESVPTSQNTMIVSEDVPQSDRLRGALPHGNYLYLLKERHCYRLSFENNPLDDGAIYLVAKRGCINNRCWCYVEDVAYLLDYDGIWAFNGGESQAISLPIQDLFRDGGINWGARKWFWMQHSPQEEVVRTYVAIDSSRYPKHAIAYNYRLNRWWMEEYPTAFGHGTLARVGDRTQLVVGCDYFNAQTPEGTLDYIKDTTLTLHGTVTTASYTTLTDTSASFPTTCVGAPVTIVSGKGKGQTRIISARTGTTITPAKPWLTRPNTTSVYQIGGIPWTVRFGKFIYPATERDEKRELRIGWTPTTNPCQMDLRRYVNFSATAEVNKGFGGALTPMLTATHDDPDVVLNMAKTLTLGTSPGFDRWQFDDHLEDRSAGDRSISLEMRGVQGKDKVRISRLGLVGAAR